MRVPTEPPPPVTNLGAVTGAVDGVFIITRKEHTKVIYALHLRVQSLFPIVFDVTILMLLLHKFIRIFIKLLKNMHFILFTQHLSSIKWT